MLCYAMLCYAMLSLPCQHHDPRRLHYLSPLPLRARATGQNVTEPLANFD